MWTFSYVMSQICVILAMASFGITYFTRGKRKVLILNIVSSCFFCAQFIFLGAYAGVVVNAIGIARCVWFYADKEMGLKKNPISILSFVAIYLQFGIDPFTDLPSMLITITSIIFTMSLWFDSIKFYRFYGIINSGCWIIYNAFYHSTFGVILESALVVVEICGVIQYFIKKRNKRKAK